MLPNLPAFLRGEYEPAENDERLAFLGASQFEGRSAAAARLYAGAFAADPELAIDLQAGRRYVAACCAALAGCGGGLDGAQLSDDERAGWRRQARGWLRADLAAWSDKLASGNEADRALVRRQLTQWQADPDLAGLREPVALETLSPAERDECLALWKEIAALFQRALASR
jgi:serine/threonine-protein kinase